MHKLILYIFFFAMTGLSHIFIISNARELADDSLSRAVLRDVTTYICSAIYLILFALALKEIFSLSKPIVLRTGRGLGVIAGDAVQKMMNQESKLNNELKLAQEEFDRLKSFLSDGLISEDDFEKSKLNVQQKIRTILAELESLKAKADASNED